MTKIVFFRREGQFYGFEEQGHTGYGESGDDILCAALSAMTMLILNTVEISYAGDVIYDIDDTSTRVTVKCMCALPEFEADEKKRFRELTTGNVVVMGRRTYEEIGFPLPNRETIVVSNKCTYEADNCRTAGSLSEAIHMAAGKKIYISGGAGLYEEALPLAGKLYITEIHRIVEGDTYFPKFDKKEYERVVEKHVGADWL